MDYNIESYSIDDILLIFNINDNDPSIDKIEKNSLNIINKIQPTNEKNIETRQFLINLKNKLITHFSDERQKQFDPAFKSEQQEEEKQEEDEDEEDDIIDRKPLDQTADFNVQVKQDNKLNPNLKNTIEKFVVIDSKFREYSKDFSRSETNPFTVDLPDPIYNLLSFRLFSAQIPMTWYNFTSSKGNTTFFISASTDIQNLQKNPVLYLGRNEMNTLYVIEGSFDSCNITYIPVVIPDSKYDTIEGLINVINKSIEDSINIYYNLYKERCNAEFDKSSIDISFSLNPVTKKVQINLNKGCIRFFSLKNNISIDNTLGWLLGFRKIFHISNEKKPIIIASAIYNISDTKYFMIYIDDFLQNRINTNILCTSDRYNSLKPNTSLPVQAVINNTSSVELEIIKDFNEKYPVTNTTVIPSKPRQYSQNELYSYDQVQSSNIQMLFSSVRASPPVTSDAFGLIPIKGTSIAHHNNDIPYVDFSGSLQNISRNYFGPVNLRRMKISLVDDLGNTIDLNGAEWSFVIVCTVLYSY